MPDQPTVVIEEAAEIKELGKWADSTRDPFILPAFLEGSRHHGPGGATIVLLEATSPDGGHARWGVIERTKLGQRGAFAWAAPEFRGGDRQAMWNALLKALDRRGNIMLRMKASVSLRMGVEDADAVVHAGKEAKWVVKPSAVATYSLDLTRAGDKAFGDMHPSHRRKIKSARKAGLELIRVPDDRLDEVVAVSNTTYEARGLEPPRAAYIHALHAVPSHFRFFAAVDPEDRMQALAIVAMNGKSGLYLHGGSGSRDVTGSGNFLHWEVSRALAKDGFTRYDLGGIELDDADDASKGIREFKAAFGGRLEKYPAFDVDFAPLKSRIIQGGLSFARRLTG